jgi:hypothetical protein
MTTIRHIERLYNQREYNRLIAQLLAGRIEQVVRLEAGLHGHEAAAALAIIRLDELNQPHAPLYSRLVRDLLRLQQDDGGWGGIGITALVLRALLLGRGDGDSVRRGLGFLSALQKSQGIWPMLPVRRTEADPVLSAFVLLELGGSEAFRGAVRFQAAVEWFASQAKTLDPVARRIWDAARARCVVADVPTGHRIAGRLLNVA